LTVLRRRLGAGHFEVAFNVAQVAALEHERGRLRRSRRLYADALRRLEPLLGNDHPVLARVFANLGALLHDLGESGRARTLERRALCALSASLGPRHPEVVELRRACA
jgi:hypothetical protein